MAETVKRLTRTLLVVARKRKRESNQEKDKTNVNLGLAFTLKSRQMRRMLSWFSCCWIGKRLISRSLLAVSCVNALA